MGIYFDLETYPFEQAAGAIKRQAERLGAIASPPTSLERALSEAKAAEYDRENQAFLGSDRGVRAADAAVNRIFDALESGLAEVGGAVPRWDPKFGRSLAFGAVISRYRLAGRMLCPGHLEAIGLVPKRSPVKFWNV